MIPGEPVVHRTIGDLIEQSARRFAHAPALLAGSDRVLSHRQLADLRALRVAAVQSAGITPGDRVAVVLPKSSDAAAASLASANHDEDSSYPLPTDSTSAAWLARRQTRSHPQPDRRPVA